MRSVPISQDHWLASVVVPGETPPPGDRRAFLNSVSPGWFSMFGVPLLAGRDFGPQDRPNTELVAIVNETFVRRFTGGRSLVGETVRFSDWQDSPPFRIIGFVGDSGAAIYFGLREEIPPTVYLHVAQRQMGIRDFTPLVSYRIAVRGAQASPLALVRGTAAAIERVDPDLKTSFRTMSDYIDATVMYERLAAILAGLFGALALLLAAVGLYGVTAQAVGRRRPEIGVRVALGATPGRVVRMVLSRVVALVAIGVVVGGALSLWAARFGAALLFGLRPNDPATFAGAAVVLAGAALFAGWLPARRAARIDPVTALRVE
jgi:predicted permease